MPALSAIRQYSSVWAQWGVAIMVGLLLVAIVLLCGKVIAYIIKNPHHRDEEANRLRWKVMIGLAIAGVIFTLLVPIFLNYSREFNEGILNALGQAAQADQRPAGDNPLEELAPSLFWTLVLQEAGLIAGLIGSTLWALGDDHRHYQKEVVGSRDGLRREVAGARRELERLALEDEATLERELAAADRRHYVFCRCRDVSAARRPDKPNLGRIPEPDHKERIRKFRIKTRTIDGSIDEIRRQIMERLGLSTPERRALGPGEPAKAEEVQDTVSADGSGPKAQGEQAEAESQDTGFSADGSVGQREKAQGEHDEAGEGQDPASANGSSGQKPRRRRSRQPRA